MAESEYRIEVVRHGGSRAPSFGWQLFFGSDKQPVQSPRRVFATEVAAREAGQKALKEFLRLTNSK